MIGNGTQAKADQALGEAIADVIDRIYPTLDGAMARLESNRRNLGVAK